MNDDARFEDGAEQPLRLRAERPEDLAVISALAQDAVATVGDVGWSPRRRRMAILLNRFRWEDAPAARRQRRPFERVRAILTVENVAALRATGIDPRDKDMVISVLSIGFEADLEGGGLLRLVLAGDGEIVAPVEWLDVTLADVTQPYRAPSGRAPDHAD